VEFDSAFTCLFDGKLNNIHGHVNWRAATYDGELFWKEHSSALADDDYNFALHYLNDLNGLTSPNLEPFGNGGHSDLEFDSDETVDHWGKDASDRTYFWPRFHAAVDDSDFAAADLVNRRYAIVTGLLGLDFSHSASSELHPVWALAVRYKSDSSSEDWAIFLRNWGNEGWCSRDQWEIFFNRNRYTFALPWRGTDQAVPRVVPTARFLTTDRTGVAAGPDMTFVPGQKVLVSFTLPPPPITVNDANVPAIFGVLHLTWIGHARPLARLPKLTLSEEEPTTEALIGVALRTLPPAVVQDMIGRLHLARAHGIRVIKPRRKARTVRRLKAIPRPKHQPKLVKRPAEAKVSLDALRRQLLCHAFAGHVPGVDICR
jgi:hypothetical protein